MAAGRWVGRGDKEGGDGAAVDAMRELVNSVSMRGVVVIGEGEKDKAPMLYNGEEVGNGDGPECDFAVDPVDGTTLMSKGMPNAISVLAVAERGAMFDPSAVFYMNKIAVGPDAADVIDITAPIGENIRAGRQGRRSSPVSDMTVCILDRPRHAELIAESARPDARIRLISDGDVAGAISACRPRLRHRHAGRHRRHARRHHRRRRHPLHGRRDPGAAGARRTTPNVRRRIDAGHDLDRVLTTEDLVSGENVFFCATGVTDGDLLKRCPLLRRRLHHPVDRHAVEVRHRPDDRGLPPAFEAQRILRDRLHRRHHRQLSTAVTTTKARDHHTWPTVPSTRKPTRAPTASSTTPWARSGCRSNALWRAQTQRAVENFPISGRGLERTQIRALGLLKGACAQVNKDLGLLDPEKADAIIAAAARDRRRPARRPVPHRRVPNRFGHKLEHERQRGDRRHRRAERRHGAPQRRRQHVAVVQRHLPDRDAHRGHGSSCAAPDSGARGRCTSRWRPRRASGAPS